MNEILATVWLTLLLVLTGFGAGVAASTADAEAEVAVVAVAADARSGRRRSVVPARRQRAAWLPPRPTARRTPTPLWTHVPRSIDRTPPLRGPPA